MNLSIKSLIAFTIFSVNLAFASDLYKIMHCNEGRNYDCSDCDAKRTDKKLHSFKILKQNNSVIFGRHDNGVRVHSFTLNKCVIGDRYNWICHIPIQNNSDMYEETITHKMERGFYELKMSSPQGQARYCGIQTAN